MFTAQASQFTGQLTQAGFTPQQATLLLNILGNCAAELLHRGNVVLEADPRVDPADMVWRDGRTITPETVQNYYATLRVSNHNSSFDETTPGGGTGTISGGLTVIVNGGLYADFIVGPNGSHLPTGETTTETVLTGCSINASGDLVFTRKTITVLKSVAAADLTVSPSTVDLVTDVDWDAPDLKQRKRTSIKVFHAGTLESYAVVDTAEACV